MRTPDGAWLKCDGCGEVLYRGQLEKNHFVCPKCSFHFRIPCTRFVEYLVDGGELERRMFSGIRSTDPLDFPGYAEKLKRDEEATGLNEAAMAGIGKVGGHSTVLFLSDFRFLGGSMGSAYGETFTRAAHKALELRYPLVSVVSSGGGARMYEGILSLMQMAKTIGAVNALADAGVPYVSVIADPTMGGVMASFAALGDVVIAEPGALIGFAGPRVIKNTIRQELPEGFQRAEFLLEKGQVDAVVERGKLKATLVRVLDILCE